MLMCLNILCLICIKLHYTWNYAKFAKKHRFYPIFNSCLCSQERKWTVPITVITYAAGIRSTVRHLPFFKDDFLFQQDVTLQCTQFALHCWITCVPCAGVHWTGKLTFSSLDLNTVDCSRIALQNFTHCPAETHANQQLNSVKRGHIELSDLSAAKKTDDGYQSTECPCWISSGQILCADNCCCYFHCILELKMG